MATPSNRPSTRANNQLRQVEIIRNYTKHAEGAVLVKFGDTHVLCTASVEEKVPGFLKGQEQGSRVIVNSQKKQLAKNQLAKLRSTRQKRWSNRHNL